MVVFSSRPCRLYKQGAVSFMAMNLHPNRSVDLQLEKNLRQFGVDEYLFSPEESITSRLVTVLSSNLMKVSRTNERTVFNCSSVIMFRNLSCLQR